MYCKIIAFNIGVLMLQHITTPRTGFAGAGR